MVLLAVSGNWLLLSFAVMLLIPVIIVSIIFLWKKQSLQKSLSELAEDCLFDSNIRAETFCKIYAILLLLTLSWILFANSRDWLFLLLIVLMYGVSIVQLFSKTLNSRWVVAQLTLTTLIVTLTKQFCYYYYNNGDSMVHAHMAYGIIETGGLSFGSLLGDYANFALSHIMIVATSLMSGLPAISALCVSGTIPIIIGGIFVYYIANYFIKSERIAALAVLLYFLTPIVIEYAWKASPRTLSTLAFIMILYFLFQRKEWNSWILCLCAGIMALYMIMVHHAQLPLLMLSMTTLVVSYWVYFRKFSKNQVGVLILFYAVPLIYYLYTYLGSLLGILDKRFFSLFGEIGITESADFASSAISLTTYLNLSVGIFMVTLILFGIYFILLPQNIQQKTIILWPLALLLFPVFLPGVTASSAFLSSMEQIGRLQIVLSPLFAIVMSAGCVIMISLFGKNSSQRKYAVIFAVIFLLLFVIASPVIYNSKDSSFFKDTDLSVKSSFDNSEVAMFTWVSDFVIYGSNIYSDYIVTRYYPAYEKYHSVGLPYYSFPAGVQTLFTNESIQLQEGYLLYRENEFVNRGLTTTLYGGNNAGFDTEHIKYDAYTENSFSNNTQRYDVIYDLNLSKIYYW
ncbi:MAG: hypothetical protein PHF34_00945 [Bacteroidales bacterium]|nr:hypothetical protein [Bacteroidales bacterium]